MTPELELGALVQAQSQTFREDPCSCESQNQHQSHPTAGRVALTASLHCLEDMAKEED